MPQHFEPEDNVRPEDYEWQLFTADFDYLKAFYDVRLKDGTIIKHCWPNAGKMNAIHDEGQQRQFTGADGVQVRLSPEHPEDELPQPLTSATNPHTSIGVIGGASLGHNKSVAAAIALAKKHNVVLVDIDERKEQERLLADRFIQQVQGASLVGGIIRRAEAMAAAMITKGRSRRKYTASYRDRVKMAKSNSEVLGIVAEAKKAGVGNR